VKKRILALAEASRVHLVETLATRVAEICLEQPRVQCVEVTGGETDGAALCSECSVTIVRARNSA